MRLLLAEAKSNQSSAESEYHALALGICEEMWLQRLLRELKVEITDIVKMFSDSQAAISIAKIFVHHDILERSTTESFS